ncbi:MAG: hypothetical protein CMH61_00760 [Nanoarchaeota archaeon]|nr:hypothetical protein [Nanoarchaeota archaeon]|tara:strand:+ start:174 stop:887 length:714 start_codon:yes stop_codon:yes gene_type:complete
MEVCTADTIARALELGAKEKIPASMPQLLEQLVKSGWHGGQYTTLSEEISGHGTFRNETNDWVITTHGEGWFTSLSDGPKRIREAVKKKLTRYRGGKVTKKVFNGMLNGSLEIPIFTYDEFLEESDDDHFLRNYSMFSVVRTLEQARLTHSNFHHINSLENDSQVIVYAGGKERARRYLDSTTRLNGENKIGVWNPFNGKKFSTKQAQGHILFVGDYIFGLIGDLSLEYFGKFVSIS